jgi:hypothetical protein
MDLSIKHDTLQLVPFPNPFIGRPIPRWSQWPGLNRRPTVYETVALPLSYIGMSALKVREAIGQGFPQQP